MHKDRQRLRQEHQRLKAELSAAQKQQQQLTEAMQVHQQHYRQIKNAITRISSILPKRLLLKSSQHQIVAELKLAKDQEQAVKEQLAKLRNSAAATRLFQSQVYQQALHAHNELLSSQLTKAKKTDEFLFRKSDLTTTEKQAYSTYQELLLHEKESRRLSHELALRTSYKEQQSALQHLNDRNLEAMQHQAKQLQKDLAEAQFLSEGLEYELAVIEKYKCELPLLEKQLNRTAEAISQRQEKIQLLHRTLEDKTTTHAHMKKWTDQLKERLDEKKRVEAQAKEKLESKINQLNKEFQEWNSRYKTLLMQDRAVRHVRRTKEAPQQQPTKKQKVRAVKRYQIERICKKLNFMLTLQGSTAQDFAETIVGDGKKLTVEVILQRLKKVEGLAEDSELPKLARFVMEDNDRPQPNDEIDSALVKMVLANTIDRPMSLETYESNLEFASGVIARLHDDICHEIYGAGRTNHFDEERLQQVTNFFEVKLTPQHIRSVCIKLFEEGDDIDAYSLLTFKKVFAKPAAQEVV